MGLDWVGVNRNTYGAIGVVHDEDKCWTHLADVKKVGGHCRIS